MDKCKKLHFPSLFVAQHNLTITIKKPKKRIITIRIPTTISAIKFIKFVQKKSFAQDKNQLKHLNSPIAFFIYAVNIKETVKT